MLLVDLSTPNFDAAGFIKCVQTNEDLSGMNVIAMSGSLTDGQAAGLARMGYCGSLHKPFTVRDAIDCIEGANAVI